MRTYCPFHTHDDVEGTRQDDGSYNFECREAGHPGGGPYYWLHVPQPKDVEGPGGLAEELNLPDGLISALASLGKGWFEYGLVERAYALANPDDFKQMVERWGHTAIGPKQYTASAYIGGVLGRMSSQGLIHYHPGPGTGRWSYNQPASYWAADPATPWESRTTWADALGDDDGSHYVPGASGSTA